MNRLRTIVWDVDDVLNDLMRQWLASWRHSHPGCDLRYEDLKANPPHEALGVTQDRYLRSLDAFRLSRSYQQMTPATEVREWFHGYGRRFRHIALSAVPLRAASVTAEWVFRHFGIWIRTFEFVPSKRRGESIPQYDRYKADVLQRFGDIDFFIDDNDEQIAVARKAGIHALAFPRPWNQSDLSIEETLAGLQAD